MKKIKDVANLDIFAATFLGQQVSIMTKMKSTVVSENEQGMVSQTAPMVLNGYLLGYDNTYYYIGDTLLAVSQAIKKVQVFHVELYQDKDIYDHILEAAPAPPSKKGYN